MNGKVLVTGATGVLGRAIVNAVLKADLPVRQGVREPGKANPAAEAVRLDYGDPATVAPALVGVSKLVLIAPPLDANAPAELGPVIEAAKSAGVAQLVFLSAFGVNYNERAPLRVVEHLVMGSGIPYSILRPNFFMENFSQGFLAGSIKTHGAIHLAAGEGKTSFITVEDIAAVVVVVLQQNLTGREFDLTGPEALDHATVARLMSEASGRQIAYHAQTEEEMTAGARAAGMPDAAAAYLAILYGVVRAGLAGGVTDEVEKLTGRPAIAFEKFARGAAAAWTQA